MMIYSPSKKPKRRLFLTGFFALSTGIGGSLVLPGILDSHQQQKWQTASQLDAALLQQVVQENHWESAETDPFSQMAFLTIQPSGQSSPLFVFDFNEPKLCGKGGCLFAVYLRDLDTGAYQKVLRVLLPKPFDIPPRISLIESRKHQGVNCLNISLGVQEKTNPFKNLSYCYNGNTFVQVNQEFEKSKEKS
ncbi:hypothetical protein [Coleofasciculus sp.]|uniref:hypothetical protein n=1 Tax=Coleofasciculus sp. TaxID=3100458 RepID=UPI003A137FA6